MKLTDGLDSPQRLCANDYFRCNNFRRSCKDHVHYPEQCQLNPECASGKVLPYKPRPYCPLDASSDSYESDHTSRQPSPAAQTNSPLMSHGTPEPECSNSLEKTEVPKELVDDQTDGSPKVQETPSPSLSFLKVSKVSMLFDIVHASCCRHYAHCAISFYSADSSHVQGKHAAFSHEMFSTSASCML